MVDFGESVRIKVTHYSMEHMSSGFGLMRGWYLQGSHDGQSWNVLKEHDQDNTLQYNNTTATWAVDECPEYYRYFKIQLTQRQHHGHWEITAGLLEIYGYFMDAKGVPVNKVNEHQVIQPSALDPLSGYFGGGASSSLPSDSQKGGGGGGILSNAVSLHGSKPSDSQRGGVEELKSWIKERNKSYVIEWKPSFSKSCRVGFEILAQAITPNEWAEFETEIYGLERAEKKERAKKRTSENISTVIEQRKRQNSFGGYLNQKKLDRWSVLQEIEQEITDKYDLKRNRLMSTLESAMKRTQKYKRMKRMVLTDLKKAPARQQNGWSTNHWASTKEELQFQYTIEPRL